MQVMLPEVKVNVFVPALILEFPRPERLREPVVEVRLIAPVERVKPFDAVRSWLTVKAPALVVVIPALPRVIPAVLIVPILIVPFALGPIPALIATFPPVPPVFDSLPALRFNVPPNPPVPDSLPALRVSPPPKPTLALLVAGCTVRELPPISVVISGERLPTSANCPVGETVRVLFPPF